MKRFRFPLQRLLGLHRAEERQARLALVQASGRVAQLAQRRELVDASQRSLDLRGAGARAYAQVLERKAVALDGLLTEARAAVERARAEFLERRARRQSLQTVRERALERHRVESAREEARDMDEIGRAAFTRGIGLEDDA